jgi:hypothetical protein
LGDCIVTASAVLTRFRLTGDEYSADGVPFHINSEFVVHMREFVIG